MRSFEKKIWQSIAWNMHERNLIYRTALILITVTCFCTSCTRKAKDTFFTPLTTAESGINFSNDSRENDSAGSFINDFGYMGGGVGIGDFNNDGLKDLFLQATR
jgi:hypothetical protein